MEKNITIHLREPNTLARYLCPMQRMLVESLKITGKLGRKDFEDVLSEMCDTDGIYDDDDNFIPDYEESPRLRHLDLGEATFVDGDELPDFGDHAALESLILPKGIRSTCDFDNEGFRTGFSDSEMLKTLVLPEELKTVGGFNSCPHLKDLVLPEGLEEITDKAFCGCEGITHIRIPASVKYLYGSSFAGCNIKAYEVAKDNPYFVAIDGVIFTKNLDSLVAFPSAYPYKEYVVPETTTVIGYGAFRDSKIEHVSLPASLTFVEREAFCGSSIRAINIPDGVKKINHWAFAYCDNLTSIKFPKGLHKVSEGIFTSCNQLKELEIPSSIKDIDYSNFIWNPSLVRIILHDGLEMISGSTHYMRYGGNLKSVRLPKTLKKIPGGIFNYCSCLDDISVDPDNPYFCMYEGALCSKDKKTLYSVPEYQIESYTVPDGIEEIYDSAFAFIPNLRTVILPSTLKIIGAYAFHQCNSISQFHIPAKVVKIDMGSLWSDNLKTVIMDCNVPPKMTGYVNDNDWRYKDVNLLVPPASVAAYKNAPGWNSFNVKEYTKDENR